MTTLFNDFLKEWLESIREIRTLSTYVRYCQISEKYLIPYFSGKLIQEIKREDLIIFRNTFYSSRGEVKSMKKEETLRIMFIILNQVLRYASDEGVITEIPQLKVQYRQAKRIVNVFSEEQQKKLETFIKKNKNETTVGILLCLYTGLRIGELCALRWENIDLDEGILYVRNTIQRLPIEDGKTGLLMLNPKSASSTRQVPVPSFLIPFLWEQRGQTGKECFVISGKDVPMEPRTLQYRYKRFLKQADVSYLNFHALRHTFATRCISIGIDPKTLSEILGHSNIRITMEYFSLIF